MMMMENTFPSGDDDDVHRLVLLPGDVLIEILVWLPIVSLLRFKSVCKSWLALIESSLFIHLHSVTSSSSSTNKFSDFIFETKTRVFMLTSDGNGGGGVEVKNFGFPPFYKTEDGGNTVAMVGSCNGLICLHDPRGGDVSLWNPATRQFRLLPKSLTLKEEEEEEEKIGRHVYGFGFDVKTKDYKVVKISTLFHRKVVGTVLWAQVVETVLRAQVYSLSSNSWRVLEEEGDGGINSLFAKPVHVLAICEGVYLNGRFFFDGFYSTQYGGVGQWVLPFDFTKEIFTAIQFPANHGDCTSPLFLACYENKIATLSRRGGDDDSNNLLVYDIWVLNIIEHDDQEKEEEEEATYYWTELQHSIQITKPKQMIPFIRQPIIPRFISNEGEFALIETRGDNGDEDWKLQLFNLFTKEEKTLVPTGMGLQRAHVYKPSLVSIVGGGGNGNGTVAAAAAAAADWGDFATPCLQDEPSFNRRWWWKWQWNSSSSSSSSSRRWWWKWQWNSSSSSSSSSSRLG